MTSKPSSALFKNSIPYSPGLGLAFGTTQALLIQQIHYWCSKCDNERDGHFWVYKSYQGWASEIPGFDPKTMQRALETLRQLGVIVVGNYNKFKYDRTLWYRVDYVVLRRQLESLLLNWTICLDPSGQFVLTPLDKMTTPIPETTQKTTEETPGVDFATQIKPKRIKIPSGKEPANLIENPPMAKEPTSTSAILQSLKVANGTALPSGNTSKAAQGIWQRLVPREHQSVGMMPELTLVEKGQLSKIVSALGNRSDETLTYIIKNWISYCKFVEGQVALKKSPNVPHIGFVLKYVGQAGSFTAAKMQLIAPKPIVKGKAFKPVPVETVETPAPPVAAGDEIASADFVLGWKPED